MRKVINLILLFTATSYSQDFWTLDDCIDHARINNIQIIKQVNTTKLLKEDIRIAKNDYLPDLNFNASQGFSLGNSFNVSTGVGQRESLFSNFSISSSLKLFDGFLNKYSLRQARLEEKKGLVDLDALFLDLSIDIANKYLVILFNEEILKVAEEQVLISVSEEKRLRLLYEKALVGKPDYLRLKSTLEIDKREVLIAKNNLETSLIELQNLLNINAIEDFRVKKIKESDFNKFLIPTKIDELIEQVLNKNPNLQSAELDKLISEEDLNIIKSDFYPQLNFTYSYGSSFFGILNERNVLQNPSTLQLIDNGFFTQLINNRTHFLSFNLTVPIFNRFNTRSKVTRSELLIESLDFEIQNEKSEFSNKVRIAYNDLLTAQITFKTAKTAASLQEEIFEIVSKRYKEGLESNSAYLENKSNYIRTISELVQSKYDYFFKIKVLEYYLFLN